MYCEEFNDCGHIIKNRIILGIHRCIIYKNIETNKFNRYDFLEQPTIKKLEKYFELRIIRYYDEDGDIDKFAETQLKKRNLFTYQEMPIPK